MDNLGKDLLCEISELEKFKETYENSQISLNWKNRLRLRLTNWLLKMANRRLKKIEIPRSSKTEKDSNFNHKEWGWISNKGGIREKTMETAKATTKAWREFHPEFYSEKKHVFVKAPKGCGKTDFLIKKCEKEVENKFLRSIYQNPNNIVKFKGAEFERDEYIKKYSGINGLLDEEKE